MRRPRSLFAPEPQPDRESGFALVEVVVAIAILALVLEATTGAIASLLVAAGEVKARDGANAIAADTLDSAESDGCGLQTGADTSRATVCFGADGDVAFTPPSRGGVPYAVTLSYEWRQLGAAPTDCLAPGASPDADGIVRAAIVTWWVRGRAHTLRAETFEAVPPDAVAYHDSSRGGIELRAASGDGYALLTGPSGQIGRAVDARTGCAFFPFLPPGGSYRVDYLASAAGLERRQFAAVTVQRGTLTSLSA